VRLEVPASSLGLEGKTLNGMAFTLYGGRASWDKAGKVGFLYGAGPPINNRVYTVDAGTNRLTSVNGAPMSYDAAGNQTNDGSGQRTYDAENRMLTATNGGLGSSYTYTADGRRVKRVIGGVETWQIYGIEGELLAEYAAGAASSAPQKEYGYRGGQLLVVWDGSETGDRQLQWLVQDHLGSTRMVVDRSGSLGGVRRHDFAPFGEELFAGAAIRSAINGYSVDLVRQKFDGYERDSETGLDFAQTRYFSNIQGRFTSPDIPFADQIEDDPQSWNLYSYVKNNPTIIIDPSGRSTHTDINGVVIAVYNDKDLGVYRHTNYGISNTWNGKSKLLTSGKSVEKMGETEYLSEFSALDRNGNALWTPAEGAVIEFGKSFDDTIREYNELASGMDLREIAQKSRNGGLFDIKVSKDVVGNGGPNVGRLLNGKYATARSAGNYLAGLNGATEKIFGNYITFETYMKVAGSLHKGQFSSWNAFRIGVFGKSFGSPPWYGEIEYTGRRCNEGFTAGMLEVNKRTGNFPFRH
jgi:RHS repeat-associated protein